MPPSTRVADAEHAIPAEKKEKYNMGNTSQKRKRKSMKVTPVPLRMIVLLGYLEIFRLGVMFTYNVLFTSGEVASISAAAMNTTTNALLNSSSSESTFIGENGKDMFHECVP